MTLDEIKKAMHPLNVRKIERDTGLSYPLLLQFANGTKQNATLKTLMLLTKYLKGRDNE